jgi:hypothetical protein
MRAPRGTGGISSALLQARAATTRENPEPKNQEPGGIPRSTE